jgi:hypothetical protein
VANSRALSRPVERIHDYSNPRRARLRKSDKKEQLRDSALSETRAAERASERVNECVTGGEGRVGGREGVGWGGGVALVNASG